MIDRLWKNDSWKKTYCITASSPSKQPNLGDEMRAPWGERGMGLGDGAFITVSGIWPNVDKRHSILEKKWSGVTFPSKENFLSRFPAVVICRLLCWHLGTEIFGRRRCRTVRQSAKWFVPWKCSFIYLDYVVGCHERELFLFIRLKRQGRSEGRYKCARYVVGNIWAFKGAIIIVDVGFLCEG